jgi:tripartite-type tricarboxylate transporter receptor subunit TctC
MRTFLAALVLATGCVTGATAEVWPNRTVTMVVPFPAGGSADAVGRVLAQHLSERLGQQVIVENIAGAGGMNGEARVARAGPDGYQFVLGTVGTHAFSQSLHKAPAYNVTVDFAPVVLIAETPNVLVVRKSLPAHDLREFVAYVKANQGKVQYGSGGTGSAGQLACALLNAASGITVTHIPYRGGPPAMQDLVAGRIDYQCVPAPVALPQISSNLVNGLAILGSKRSPILPSLATAREQGLEDFEASAWYALFLPKHTPMTIVTALHDATVAAMDTPSLQAALNKIGVDLVESERRSPEHLKDFVRSEVDKWARAIKAAGIAVN